MELSLLDIKFVGILALVATARKFCPVRYYPQYGVAVSALLVGVASVKTLAIITLITLLYLYPVHLLWRHLRARKRKYARLMLGLSIAGLVLLLFGFKVYRQFKVPFLGGLWASDRILALVGFSYFVLRAINFLHIQSILDVDERTPWGLLFFMLFPPTVTSGPIQKYQDFAAQILAPLPLTAPLIAQSVYRITRGYFRKAVLAYVLDQLVKRLLGLTTLNAYGSLAIIVLLYLYFYFDFAGYSDVAIGFGGLMGIRVPENFRNPFLATSVSEFWRHWHITLVDWFRDNVFIPLGGMRSGRIRAACLALLIMVLCGMWHGLTIAFIAWGCWHGMLLFLEAVTGSKPMPPSQRHGPRYWSRVLWTNARVAFGGLLFLPSMKSTLAVLGGLAKWY
jgi:alginate O-acetyltransferase complex protein AlgI